MKEQIIKYMKEEIIKQTIDFLVEEEKIMPRPYVCPGGHLTNGAGFTVKGLMERKMDVNLIYDKLTREQSLYILNQMVEYDYKLLSDLNLPLNINQSVACLSFIYNCGFKSFVANLKDPIQAKDETRIKEGFLKVKFAGETGKKEPILESRRKKELEIFSH